MACLTGVIITRIAVSSTAGGHAGALSRQCPLVSKRAAAAIMSDMTATRAEPMHVETDVLIIGSGGAGMYAAIEAARAGCSVFLAERSLIGRGGATVMAQMTVAVALGSQTPDHWSLHYNDTLEAGRGLCDERLARLLCEDGPARIREMDDWGIGWPRPRQRSYSTNRRRTCARWVWSCRVGMWTSSRWRAIRRRRDERAR